MELYCLRTNLLRDPLGIDSANPEFSWKFSTETPNATQSAYEIVVSSDASFGDDHAVWKSGKTDSDAQFGVVFEGSPLQNFSRYFWRVRIWDKDGVASGWSATVSFETAVLDSSWRAQWITPSHQSNSKEPAYLYGQLHLPSSASRGRAFFSALGWYRLFVNGINVTGDALVPRWTPFDSIVEYQAYDITQYLKSGTNHISVAVGDGRYRGNLGLFDGRERYGNKLAVFGQLEITTESGEHITFATDETWQSTSGPIMSSDPMSGEHADLRIGNDDWLGTTTSGIEDKELHKTETIQHSRQLVAESVERVQCVELLPAKQVLKSPSGKQIVDFGQNFAGWIRVKLDGLAGTRILLTFSEVLTKAGELNTSYLCPPLSVPPQQDSVILSGKPSWFETWFTIHGFRYVEIQGLDYDLDPSDVEAKVISSALIRAGSFSCSNPSLERLHRNLHWGIRSNFVDVPTDCPTRERSGWTGDIQVFAPTATMFLDCQAFFRHYLRSLAAEQLPDGTIPPYIPSQASAFSGGLGVFARTTAQATGWGDAAVLLPWTLYSHYGDVRVLRDMYPCMRKWVDYLAATARNHRSWRRWLFSRLDVQQEQYVLDTGFHWGEWLRPGESPGASLLRQFLVGSPSIATAYLAHSARILSQTAAVLGRADDAARYETLADSVRKAWNAAFVTCHKKNNGRVHEGGEGEEGEEGEGGEIRIGLDTQDEYVRALSFALLPASRVRAAVARLVALVEAAHDHLATGFLSTAALLPVLVAHGRADVAWRLLLQDTAPAWLALLRRDATTLWETWEGYDASGEAYYSHNHYALGAFAIWLEEGVAGLAPAAPGWRRVRVRPVVGGGLTHAMAERDTPFGLACSEWWREEDGSVRLEVTVPPGTTAEVHLGDGEMRCVGSGRWSFELKVE